MSDELLILTRKYSFQQVGLKFYILCKIDESRTRPLTDFSWSTHLN